MSLTSPSYTVTMRVQVPYHPRATQHLVEAVADAGALVTGIDMLESLEDYLIVLLTCDCVNTPHVNEVNHQIEMMRELRFSRSLMPRWKRTTAAKFPSS